MQVREWGWSLVNGKRFGSRSKSLISLFLFLSPSPSPAYPLLFVVCFILGAQGYRVSGRLECDLESREWGSLNLLFGVLP